MLLKISEEFSKTPGPRYIAEGLHSGELFRTDCLLPRFMAALSADQVLTVDLDGTFGYGMSFLEEAFAGLIRVNQLPPKQVKSTLRFKSDDEPYLIDEINEYIDDACAQS